MIRFSFHSRVTRASRVESPDRSAFPLGRWLVRLGTGSALAACLMTAFPNTASWALAASNSVAPTPQNVTPFSPLGDIPASEPAELSELDKAVRDLSDPNPAVRKSALERIAWMGPEAERAIVDVAVCLQDSHPEVRAYAAKTLWDIDRQSALAAVNTLRDMIDSTQPGARPLAAFYLGYIGPKAVSALPTLKRALASAESIEQLQIAEAVARIHPTDPDAVTVLIGGLRDPESHIRFQAAYALGEVSPVHADRVVPALATAMRDQSPQVRQAAELALASFPPVSAPLAAIEPVPAVPEMPAISPVISAVPEMPAVAPVFPAEEWPADMVALLDPEPVPPANGISQPAGGDNIVPETPGHANVIPSKAADLGLGEDYKPITAVNISITPKRRDEDGTLLALPTNYGAAWLQDVGTEHHPIGESRPWPVQSVQYAASGFCHRPLYFEEINLERYGHNFGHCVQPFVSGVAFFGRAPLLPYMMAAEPPCECQYTLGHYRPGSCAPYYHYRLPWSTKGALLEAGLITGLFFAIY